jgi:IS30 family transposase
MTAERRADVERMLRSGYSIAATARAIGVVPATIYNNFGRDKISALRAEAVETGEEDHSRQQPAVEESNHLRVIK